MFTGRFAQEDRPHLIRTPPLHREERLECAPYLFHPLGLELTVDRVQLGGLGLPECDFHVGGGLKACGEKAEGGQGRKGGEGGKWKGSKF